MQVRSRVRIKGAGGNGAEQIEGVEVEIKSGAEEGIKHGAEEGIKHQAEEGIKHGAYIFYLCTLK